MNSFKFLFLLLFSSTSVVAQNHSVAHEWSEVLLEGIRKDFARPTVHARNLYHLSSVMYDAWAVYDTTGVATTVLLGKDLNSFTCALDSFPMPNDIEAAREEAISFAAYRLLLHRFAISPANTILQTAANQLMISKGYSINNTSLDYVNDGPAALGNYLGQCMINYGLADNSNEVNNYENQYYNPVNPPMIIEFPGNETIEDYNRWQPLTLDVFIDQSGNVIPFNTPEFLSPEWGNVHPFAMTEANLDTFERNGDNYLVYHDPGLPPLIDTADASGMSEEYKWGFQMVAKWSSHLDPALPKIIDISPRAIGNVQDYPTTIEGLRNFYNYEEGGDTGIGHELNPSTGEAYTPQLVRRGDYARVLAEFWADGPDSETPPGHWFSIYNEIKDHPDFVRKYNGQTDTLGPLEYDVKLYLTLGGAMHDAAVAVWGIKGWYDYIRPVTAIRAMASLGQSSDSTLMNYHPGGMVLDSGAVELVMPGDTLAGPNNEHVGKIKILTWRGPDYINNPTNDIAGVDWILAENWWSYQRPSFVTPNFAGYVSGHSTFSRAAAEVMTMVTGDAFFPGGMGTFLAPQNNFLVFEKGPSFDIELQWATYRDASDQCSLSRIWGGIHPGADDIPGRLIGIEIGTGAFNYARELFYNDEDGDGYYSYEDCNDQDPNINPSMPETCDGLDNNCDENIDEDLDIFTYYLDSDNDTFGDENFPLDTCLKSAPLGYANNALDCNDQDSLFHPNILEVCDGLDNNCDENIDEGLDIFTYYLDSDNDTFGDENFPLDTCLKSAPLGYVNNALDCNDQDSLFHPNIPEICDGLDNNCDDNIDEGLVLNRFYMDGDNDGFGDVNNALDTCGLEAPMGYVVDSTDCDDTDVLINPAAMEIANNGIDEDCSDGDLINGVVNYGKLKISLAPNPFESILNVQATINAEYFISIFTVNGVEVFRQSFRGKATVLNITDLEKGIYIFSIKDKDGNWTNERLVKL